MSVATPTKREANARVAANDKPTPAAVEKQALIDGLNHDLAGEYQTQRRRPALPTICGSGSSPVPPLPSPLASSAQGRSSLATSANSTWSKNSRARNRPTNGS